MIQIYIKNNKKLFLNYNNEIHLYEFDDLDFILEEILNEFDLSKHEIRVILDYNEFILITEEIEQTDSNNYIIKDIKLNHNIRILYEKEKLKILKNTFKIIGLKLVSINIDLISLLNCMKNNIGNANKNILLLNEVNSINLKKNSNNEYEIELIELKSSDVTNENYDFDDIQLVMENKNDIELIFKGDLEERTFNIIEKRNFFGVSKIWERQILIYVIFILSFVITNNITKVDNIKQDMKKLNTDISQMEKEYKNKRTQKKESTLNKDLNNFQQLEMSIKRKEYYSFIKFLIDMNKYNNIWYLNVKYNKEKWIVEGEFEKYEQFDSFEKYMRKKYKNNTLNYIKDKDTNSIFEYAIDY